MLRVRALLAALIAALALTLGLPHPTASALPAHRATSNASQPLQVTLTDIPTELPRHGKVQVSGTITNLDHDAWERVNLYPFASSTPITTVGELADAVGTDPLLPVGERITLPGGLPYATIARLAPGATKSFSFSIARSALPRTEGVYWFGVHALGEGPDGRDLTADGRARTFVPVLSSRRQLPVSLVLALRHRIVYAADGSLARENEWRTALSPGGRLYQVVALGARSQAALTWLLDPALLDAVQQLADGNPARSLRDTTGDGSGNGSGNGSDGDGSQGSTGSGEASPSASATSASGDGGGSRTELSGLADAARSWIATATTALNQASQVLALPYGDLDLAGTAAHDPTLYQRARKRSEEALTAWNLTASPAVAPPSGYLAPDAVDLLEPGVTVVAADTSLRRSERTDRPVPSTAEVAGHQMALTSTAVAAGGPAPGDPYSDLALRQRIAAEAALRLRAPGPDRPLLVELPPDWTPASNSTLISGLQTTPWIRVESVSAATSDVTTREVAQRRMIYPAGQARIELDSANFTAAEALIAAGHLLDAILPFNDVLSGTVESEALTGVGYSARIAPFAAAGRARAATAWIRRTLAQIHLSTPQGVILSGTSGRFSATLTNDLDVTVSVKLDALSDQPLSINVPDTIQLPPNSRTPVLLEASTGRTGVHNLTLVVTDTEGQSIGVQARMPIRSTQVSKLIWLVFGGGAVLFFSTVLLRGVRRLRSRRLGEGKEQA